MRRPLCSLIVVAAALLIAAGAHAAETLKIATAVPAGTSFVKELKKAGATIAERTNGRVELKLFPGGVMGADKAVLRKIKIGQLQGAVVTANGLAEINPDAQVYSLPFLFRNRAEVDYVRERLDPVIRERVRSAGYVVLGISGGGFTYLFSKQRVPRLEALADTRVWVPPGDEITARMFRNAGSQTVALPVSDVYTALQRGLIDTVAINPAGAISLQWHTGVSYYTDAPLLYLVGMMVVDQRAFQKIDEADQKTVRNVLSDAFERLNAITREDNAEALEALKSRGIEAVQPEASPGERGLQRIARQTLNKLDSEGRFDADLLARVRELVQEYRAKHGE